jgi:hypothetical protein
MHRTKFGKLTLVAAIAALALIPLAVSPANAAWTPIGAGNSGCKANDPVAGFHPGAEIGWYPAPAGSQSGVKIACVFDASTGSSIVSAKFTYHDSRFTTYHNGGARTVITTTPTGPGANCIDIADATGLGGIPGWVNRPISGGTFSSVPANTTLQARTFITAVNATACGGGAGISVTLNQVTGGLAGGIPAGTALRIDNSDSRSTNCGVTVGGAAGFTDPCANFEGPWNGFGAAETGDLSGSNIPDYCSFLATGVNTANIVNTSGSCAPAATNVVAHANEVLTYKGSTLTTTTRTVTDGSCNAATPTVVTSPAALFAAGDVGLPFYGFGAGAGAGWYITAVGAGTATVANALGTPLPGCPAAGPATFTVGDPSVTAPTDDQNVLNQLVQLDLKPSLVAGSNDCALNEAEGFGIAGKWRNPGPGPLPNGFLTSAFATQPANTKAIGEILFTTSVVSYGAFVVEHETTSPAIPGYPADPMVPNSHHYDIVFPNVPTGLALCASGASPGLGLSIGINATTVSQAAIASGLGKPGTAQLRNTNAKGTPVYGPTPAPITNGFNSVGYFYDDNAVRIWTPASRFNRTCVVPADAALQIAFTCGDG